MVIRNQILPEYVVDTIYFVIKFFVYQLSTKSGFLFWIYSSASFDSYACPRATRKKIMKMIKNDMVFCYQNCSDLLWDKIVLVKIFWNSRLKAENLQKAIHFVNSVCTIFSLWNKEPSHQTFPS